MHPLQCFDGDGEDDQPDGQIASAASRTVMKFLGVSELAIMASCMEEYLRYFPPCGPVDTITMHHFGLVAYETLERPSGVVPRVPTQPTYGARTNLRRAGFKRKKNETHSD